jgi:hypothetical protein
LGQGRGRSRYWIRCVIGEALHSTALAVSIRLTP